MRTDTADGSQNLGARGTVKSLPSLIVEGVDMHRVCASFHCAARRFRDRRWRPGGSRMHAVAIQGGLQQDGHAPVSLQRTGRATLACSVGMRVGRGFWQRQSVVSEGVRWRQPTWP